MPEVGRGERTPECAGIAWQEGYSAFSVSRSQDATLRRYIATQAEHHARYDYLDELRSLLKAHQVAFDDRHLVDEDVPDPGSRGDE